MEAYLWFQTNIVLLALHESQIDTRLVWEKRLYDISAVANDCVIEIVDGAENSQGGMITKLVGSYSSDIVC